jgi:nucleotide-binding universal stress UspA family protein
MRDFNIRRILIPTDISEASRMELGYGVLFADTLGAELVLLYAEPVVFSIDRFTGASVYVGTSSVDDHALLKKEIRTYADKSLAGKPYEVVVVGGQAIPTILQQAQESAADLIIMATHGLRGWRRAVLGSITEGVMHGAQCPVLSLARSDRVPAATTPKVTKIVCPINFTDVARESVRVAAYLAKMFASELIVVHVVEAEASTRNEKDEQHIRRWLGLGIENTCTYREVVLRGGAAERILDYVEDTAADFLIIGAQHKLFREMTVIGTTTERIIRFARVPVLTVVRDAAVA